ncbi:protein WEAK CHLOROPLAST MOVEMENT UNDER BLUE LIGHT 1-like [Gastrolobium bilobum]|uniref:protein WEAK CHLOROPLAST MOVEMENT UNDER BLUE LIGHT 1-like n=1 Tax=Gastrolobium bilobum TaxID=150636 RepID=UPI002AAF1316|nr:protein WEAK CHLOROPLAST MOVEMENT UNDER BLUE LIGHT 1-like [Gastrolobium bilobum]
MAMYNDHRVPVVTSYPPGPYTHNVAAPYPPPFPTGFPFHGYAIPPHNAVVPQPQGSCMFPGPPQYGAQQAPAFSYSAEAFQAPHPPPDLHGRNPNLRVTPANTSRRNKPLTDSLRLTLTPLGFKGPSNITMYVGDTNPFEWIQKFEAAMTLHGEIDLFTCWTFPTLLGGRALTWYTTLPTESIASWDDLASKFHTHFATSHPMPKSVHSLEKICQQSGEPLRSFLDRFDKEALQRAFAYELARHEITDLEEDKKKGQEFMRIEEYKGSRADDSHNREKKANKKDHVDEERKSHETSKYSSRPLGRDTPRRQSHNILQIEYKERKSNPQHQQPAREIIVYCKFHRSNDHNTEECRSLKDEIDALIKRGAQRQTNNSGREISSDRCRRERRRALEFTINDLTPVVGELSSFKATVTKPLGMINLRLSMGTPPTSRSADIQFLVLDTQSAYNAILGRRMFAAFEASFSNQLNFRHFGGTPNCCLGTDPVSNTEEVPLSKSSMEPLSESPKVGDETSPGNVGSPKASKRVIDTAAPFESVKDAVSKFGGRIDWKSRRTQSLERSKLEGQDFGKTETAEELESTKKLIEELKLNLERVERDELRAKEEAELVILKIEEMEQDIVNEASFEAKAQLEVEKAMHTAALSDLEFMKKELDLLHKEYVSMLSGKDIAVSTAEEAVAAAMEIEKAVEDLTCELNATKESLNSTRTAHLEAEEQRSGAVDQESHNWKLELVEAEEGLQRLNQQVLSARVLKSKLDASSSLLSDLKAELAAYMESKQEDESYKAQEKELEEVKLKIEKATAEVNSLRGASMLLKSKLEEEKLVLSTLKESEEKASAAVITLQAEMEKTRSAIAFLQMEEKEAREMMNELPKKLQEAAQEADQAKSLVEAAQVELLEAQEEAEQAKANANTLESRLLAAQKVIEASKVAEKLAKDSIKALEKSESARSNNSMDSSSLVTLTVDEYHELSKRAHKAEEQANVRVAAANSEIETAKESELRSLEKLEELNEELSVRRESLKIATENAKKATERKLAIEEELRTWRAEQEEQRKAGELNDLNTAATVSDNDLSSSKGKVPSNDTDTGSASDTKSKKKKKKSIFPSKLVMFFAKRKTHPSK